MENSFIKKWSFFFASISLTFIWISLQVFNINLLKSFGFLYDDGYCSNTNLLSAPHCFGDLLLFIDESLEGNLDDLKHTYSPAVRIIYNIFHNVLLITSGNTLIILYFCLFIISLTLSWRIVRDRDLNFIDFISISLTFAPLLFAIERGNSIIFMISFMIFWLNALENSNNTKIIFSTILIICLKTQFILILIPIIILFGLRIVVRIVVILGIINIASIIVLSGDFYQYILNVFKGFRVLLIYQDGSAEWPLNMSFQHLVGRIILKSNIDDPYLLIYAKNVFIGLFFIILIFTTFRFKNDKNHHISIIFLWIVAVIQLNPLSPYYNLVALFPFLFFSFKNIIKTKYYNLNLDKIIKFTILFNGAIIPIYLDTKLNKIQIEESSIIYVDNTYTFNLTLIVLLSIVIYSLNIHRISKAEKIKLF